MSTRIKHFAIITAAGFFTASASAEIIHTHLAEPISIANIVDGETMYFSLFEQWAANDSGPTQGGDLFQLGMLSSSIIVFDGINNGEIAFGSGSYAKYFSTGSPVSSSESFGTSHPLNVQGLNDANWPRGTRGFVGLKFDNNGTDNFGWADLEYTPDRSTILYGFAYDNSGAAIEAGAIPEPKTAALLTALAAGSVILLKRRRRAAHPNS